MYVRMYSGQMSYSNISVIPLHSTVHSPVFVMHQKEVEPLCFVFFFCSGGSAPSYVYRLIGEMYSSDDSMQNRSA